MLTASIHKLGLVCESRDVKERGIGFTYPEIVVSVSYEPG